MDERVRYINLRIISPTIFQEKDIWFIVSTEVKRLFGTVGAADVGLFLSFFDEENQGGIFRSSHTYVKRVRAALCFIHTRQENPIFIYTENITGSLKKAKKLLKDQKSIQHYQSLKKTLFISWNHHLDDDKH